MIQIVPQSISLLELSDKEFFARISSTADKLKKEKGLNSEIVKVGDAISDLEINEKEKINCVASKGFKQIAYTAPNKLNPYLKIMREGLSRKKCRIVFV